MLVKLKLKTNKDSQNQMQKKESTLFKSLQALKLVNQNKPTNLTKTIVRRANAVNMGEAWGG